MKLSNVVLVMAVIFSFNIQAHADKIDKKYFQVSAGIVHACAIDAEGVKCWGANNQGQIDVPKLNNPIQVAAGSWHTCAIDSKGVKCWGENTWGQTDVPKLNNPIQVAAGEYITCAIDSEGVKCWGNNIWGETDVPELNNPIQVSAGVYHACALDREGVKCWGNNTWGETDVPWLNNPIQISVGSYHACALDREGVKCWGNNDSGETNIPELNNPIHVSAGFKHTCALDREGVKCWGNNDSGETNIPELNNPIHVSAGFHNTCALDKRGVKCWGDILGETKGLKFNRFFGSDLADLDEGYLSVSNAVYPYKQKLFLGLSKLIKSYSDTGKLFSLNAVEPVILKTDSQVFEEEVIPSYNALLAEVNKIPGLETAAGGLSGFLLTDEIKTISNQIMQLGFNACRDYLTSDKDRKALESIQLALGKVLAGTSSIKELLVVLKANESVIENLKSGERTMGFGLMIGSLVEYLEKTGE